MPNGPPATAQTPTGWDDQFAGPRIRVHGLATARSKASRVAAHCSRRCSPQGGAEVRSSSEIGALQPMAAWFAAGSDLAGTSGAGIGRSCSIAAYGKPLHTNELRSSLPSAHTGR